MSIRYLHRKRKRLNREGTELLEREQIGSLIQIHAMTIHCDM